MLSQKLLESLPQSIRILRKVSSEGLEGSVTFQQLRVLSLIKEGKGQTQMAEAMQVSLPAISKVTEMVIKRKLVSKHEGADRRTCVLELTPSGKKVLAKVAKHVERKINSALSLLSAEDKKKLDEGLDVLNQLMVMIKEVKMIVPFLLLFFSIQSYASVSLKEAFYSARRNMETLKRAEALIDQREEQKSQAKAAILPNVSGFGTYTKIDQPNAGGINSAFTLTKQYNIGVRLVQPLLRGGALGVYQLAKENILLSEFQKDASEISLYQLVIGSYYNLQLAQNDVKNLKELLKYSKERVSEIRERTKIGRSRRGELVEAQAQLHTAEAQVQEGLMNLEVAEKNFQYYTRTLPGPIPTLPDVPKVSESLSEYLNKVRSRPDILAARQGVKVAATQIEISKGSHYPSVDLIGNYYVDRTGILQTSEWDAAVTFTLPIYQGGGVQAAVREQVAAKRVAELNASETLRNAEREMAIIYRNYFQIQEQLKALKKALSKAEEAYRLNNKDYKNGLVTNLDVLQSLNNFIQTKRSYDGLIALAHMTYKNLEASIGVLP